MFVDPIAGWRRVSNRPQRTRLDWAEEIKQLLDKDYPEAPMIKLVCDIATPRAIKTAQRLKSQLMLQSPPTRTGISSVLTTLATAII